VPPDVCEIIRNCRMFDRLDAERLDLLTGMGQRFRYRAETVIFREGDECPGLFVVGEGLVRLYKSAPSGKEHVLHMAAPGMTFAEVAVIGEFPCPARAEAMEETTCALLPAHDFRRALRRDHGLCLQLMTGMALWVRQFVGLIEDLVLRDAAGRLARYLLDASTDQGGGVVTLPSLKRHLASHLNLTSETLSRTLRRLVDAGLVENVDARHLRVIDAKALGDLAEGMFPKV